METTTLSFTELTKANLGNRNISRQNSKADGDEIVKIELSKIIIREGFNVREDYGDIESLANSIEENGQVLPGRVDILADGTFLLTDGHRRFQACLLIAKKGTEPLFKAIVNNSKTTEEQRILQMFTTQDNKPLAPHEQAELLQRLINLGYKQSDVAKKIGKTPAYVSQMLSYASESPVIKDHVKNGNISLSTATKLRKEIPLQSERIAAVSKAVAIKKETSKESNKAVSVSVEEVTGKDNGKAGKYDALATELIDKFDIEADLHSDIIHLIKKYF